jgi:hypothetical protein
MSRRDEFDTWSTLRGYLARQLVSGRLAVVLGAGVSSHFGLPTWEALITSLYSGRGGVPPDKPATFQAEDFRNKYHSRDQDSFLADVKETLYKGIDISFSRMMSHHTFSGILSILMASGPGTRTEVVSFNWDNLLEKYLALHGRVVASVFEEIHWAQSADVAIFHPHGYLPYGEITRSEKVIFDQLSYDEIMGSETIWRQVLLSLFRTRTCVLVGLSGEDQHLSALLYRVKKEHASFVNRTLFWAVAFTTSESSRGSWESRGVYPIVLTDYKELPLKLFDITEAAVGIRSKQGV